MGRIRAPARRGWMSRERVVALALLAATALALYTCYRIVQPFLPALAWALALAVVVHPLHAAVSRRVRRRSVAAGLTVLVAGIAIVVPTVFVAHNLVREAGSWVEQIQSLVGGEGWDRLGTDHPRLAPLLEWLQSSMDVRGQAEDAVKAQAPSAVATTIWAVIDVLVALFALFYFLRDREQVLASLRALVPMPESETRAMFALISDTIYATVFGTLIVSLVQGTLGGLMFWWLGLPAPLLWGSVMAVLATVPTLGAFVVWLPTAVVMAFSGQPGKALVLAAWGALVVSLIDNLLYPVLVGSRLRLHTVPVFLAIVGGVLLFGAAGLILGPVTLAVTMALLQVWRKATAYGRTVEGSLADDLPAAAASGAARSATRD
jgi:predicted PurR-regulated permease PerM